ncbi:hypothetical protein [Marinomonas spartinae]|uniref:hypothetical protein n=1 Tax=Marinomonas spartinae TaxID=1792290 RepID=UPI0018F14B43|nr:hypothetical protein [Marinomonas spartinae]MBJ7555332.1 hypothetical protein [Marinomonas spartinae]
MDELNEAISIYVKGAKSVNEASRTLATSERRLLSMFPKKIITDAQLSLTDFYTSLENADKIYTAQLKLIKSVSRAHGGNDAVDRLASQSIVVANARQVFVKSLSNFESNIANIENTLNFRINTTIALFAIVVSVIGILL